VGRDLEMFKTEKGCLSKAVPFSQNLSSQNQKLAVGATFACMFYLVSKICHR